jgi:hypothetical protein
MYYCLLKAFRSTRENCGGPTRVAEISNPVCHSSLPAVLSRLEKHSFLTVPQQLYGNLCSILYDLVAASYSSFCFSWSLAVALKYNSQYPTESTLQPEPISLRSILIPSSHLRLGLASGLFPLGFPTKPCTLFSPLSCVPHVPSTSFSLI